MTDPSPWADPTFPAGVASFDPTEDSVILWTALARPGRCTWELAADEDFAELVEHGEATTGPGAATTVAVSVDGLEPGRTYWYRFAADGTTSDSGRTRTLPSGDGARMRVGVTCCARFGQARFEVYRQLATTDVDVVIHLGDYIYEDTKCDIEGREPDPDHDCVDLHDYRRRHLQCRQDPDLQLLHRRHPMIVIWDDHDIADNAHRAGAQNHDAEQGPWGDRLAAALRAHGEFLPKRLADDDDPTSAWRELRAGTLASFVCTETRAHRDPPAGIDGAPSADDPTRTMLGSAQASWLRRVAAEPSSAWSLILTGTVMSELEIDAPEELDDVLPEKYAVEDGRAINTDQWDGYVVERAAIAAAARERGGNTVVLSGDIHSAWVVEGPADDAGPVAVEFTCPPAATTPLGQLLPQGGAALLERTVPDRLERVRWLSTEHRGFMSLDIVRERIHVTYWWVDEESSGPSVGVGRRWELTASSLPPRLVDLDVTDEDPPPRMRRALGTAGAAVGLGVVAAAASGFAARRLRHRRRL